VEQVNIRLITSAIVEALDRNGAQEMEDLYKTVQKLHDDIDNRFFEETLLSLEIQGLIRVYSTARDKRRVELVKG
jgi:hypothetical protein